MGENAAMEKLKDFFGSAPELGIRAFSSIFIVFIVIGGIITGGYAWDFIVTVIAMLSLWEFYKLLASRFDIAPGIIMFSGLFILLSTAFELSMPLMLTSIPIIAFIALFREVLRRQATGQSYALLNIGATISGLAYIVLPWSFMMLIRARDYGTLFLITLFFCTWCCDVAAYIVGSKLGRTPLCNRVSPKKTWEGFLGGAAASVLCGGILALLFSFPPLPLLLMGLLCGVAGQLGDLGESVLKREAGVKDTGSVIPGHGGLLDRFDSILVNGTLAFLIFGLIG